MVYKAPDVQLTTKELNIIVLRWKFVMKSHEHPLNPDSYFFSSFTLLYFVSQIVTQMRQAVSYTYRCMYQSILHMVFFHYFSFFTEFIIQRKTLSLPCHLRYQ